MVVNSNSSSSDSGSPVSYSPSDLRGKAPPELQAIAEELRQALVASVAHSGGHFASSLGACELTVALHAAFDTPHDRLVWDTGHQGYIHKMLTGRAAQIGSIRTKGGLSGFLKRSESEYDTFGAGHAGTSISAAVGMALGAAAHGKDGDPDRYVVGIIGDGSITSGMAFEALNHAGALGLKKFIVVVNDNEMSISPNVGALSWLFSKAVTSKASNVARTRFKNWHRAGYVPDIVYRALDRFEDLTQGLFAGASLLFESLGFRYIGPVDGHNMTELMAALEHAKTQDVPVIVHAYTTKGKGYQPAEVDPVKWHGVTPFVPAKGEFLATTKPLAPSYTQVFADSLIEIAEKDPQVVAITAAMPTGTGLDKFHERFPSRCFDVGICEQHAVTAAAGMACEGLKPVVAIYSTFLQRAYDQVIHDVAIQNLPVVFCMDRAGVVGNDGETHQGVFDIAAYRSVPHMTIACPKDEFELRAMLELSLDQKRLGEQTTDQPFMIRYPRGNGVGREISEAASARAVGRELYVGRCEQLLPYSRGNSVLLIGCGPVVYNCLAAARSLSAKGVPCTVINARFVKPIDQEIARIASLHRVCITVEDHTVVGGFGSRVLELLSEQKVATPVIRLGVQDRFVAHASQSQQMSEHRYDAEAIEQAAVAAVVDSQGAALNGPAISQEAAA